MRETQGTGSPQSAEPNIRTRRAVIAAGLAGMSTLIAAVLGRTGSAAAAAGDTLKLGQANDSGSSQTTLTNAGLGAAFTLKTTNAATGATGIFGWSSQTGPNTTRGVYGRADGPNSNGVVGYQAGPAGVGAAVSAEGNANTGVHATSDVMAVVGETGTPGGIGVQGVATAGGTGIRGDSPAYVGVHGTGVTGVLGESDGVSGIGVTGLVSQESGNTTGVRGETASSSGIGVRGVSTATTGSCLGMGASAASTSGVGLWADATATTGYAYGVVGRTASSTTNSAGVFGTTMGQTGSGVGVLGLTSSTDDSAGVFGWALATTGTAAGVSGAASSPEGIGVFGIAGPSPGVAVLGSASPGGYGVYSFGDAKVEGDLEVTGSVSKGGGGFKIDHPLDPANRFLSHSFVESPDMKNVYDGVATLDDAGQADVALPDWFEALNRDFRYQLTPIGVYAPVFVRSKIAAGRFSIAGGAAGQEVSWQVTGIRKDEWAEAHRIPVEERKAGTTRGRYLHPREHGKAAKMGIELPPAVRRGRPLPPEQPTRSF